MKLITGLHLDVGKYKVLETCALWHIHFKPNEQLVYVPRRYMWTEVVSR